MMKDMIRDRLNKMEDLEQRRMLKDLMTGVFLNLVEYQETLNKQIEQRVFDEVEHLEDKFDFYTSLINRDDYDPIHEFLSPVIASDLDNQILDVSGVVQVVRDGGELSLFTLFLELETEQIRRLLESDRTFKGILTTNAGTYPLTFRLKSNLTYLKEIEKLYHAFMLNGVSWRTINFPYIFKFVDCVLVGGEGEPAVHEEIKEISISLEEYDAYKRSDIIPLWNLESITQRNTGFPMPAIDRVNYEHTLSLRKEGTEHGYLVDGTQGDIRYIQRTEDKLIIVTPRDASGDWNMLKITNPSTTNLSHFPYPVCSNHRQETFVTRFAEGQSRGIRSKAEITRILNSLEALKGFELVDIKVEDPLEGKVKIVTKEKSVTYPLNTFVSDSIRTKHGKPVMNLSIRVDKGIQSSIPEFLHTDVLSFLVAEVQRYLPEYCCEGTCL
ncbi:normocyte-binding protein [Paenibacillus sp. LS1]|uniref:normocyte-binding protein n=1 Tax=Paenibacillus sp. LS1 TaxID=2992120 RepID=UPI0022322B22|nr:normocyte-binding protein [Paenibacillus sp. LS1]MCW3791444.1 normocyte-binding protein [Paenibacillus sp. LS1]